MKIRKYGRTFEHPPPMEAPRNGRSPTGDGYSPGFFNQDGPQFLVNQPQQQPEPEPTIYRSRRRFGWRFWLKVGALALVVLLAVGFVTGYLWIKGKERKMRIPGIEQALDPTQSGQAENTLIVGVDRGSVIGEGGYGRSDVLMLACVSGNGKQTALFSIPRDTLVAIPGRSKKDKINAAHAFGGPPLCIKTVKQFTGLDVNHYVELDFVAFRDIVNAVGGVTIHIDHAIKDKYAGDVPAGDVKLDGGQALSLVRARYDVVAVPNGDLDRVKNQRNFFKAMLSTVSRQRNPFTLVSVVDAVSNGVKTDLTFWKMFGLGRRLKGSGDALEMKSIPGEPKIISGGWYFVADKAAMAPLMAPFEPGASSTGTASTGTTQAVPQSSTSAQVVSRGDVKVEVLNGSGTTGLALTVSKELNQKGYTASAGNAKSAYTATAIYYAGGDSAKAETVAADLAGTKKPTLKRSDELTGQYGVDVLVVLGSDYSQ